MKAISFLKIAAVTALMLVGISISAPAQAAASWSKQANGPTMYQTNWQYNSTWMTPPASVPSTAMMTSVYWTTKFSYYAPGLTVYLHAANQGYFKLPSLNGNSAASGIYAKQAFRYAYIAKSSPTRMIAPSYGGGHQISVNYQY
ncbi:MAG: flagellar protein FlhE [Magnetovibrio sp.]|nr:flagellar protein FlhE [Magnetovibrio sp.]